MIIEEIQHELFRLRDLKYRDFQKKLLPTVNPDAVIGVRTPALRTLAKQYSKHPDIQQFLTRLPHNFFDENQLHAFILSEMKDFDACVASVEQFLPYIDNWATCDQLSPKIFKKNRALLLTSIHTWIASKHTYTVRFAIGMLMQHFLDEDFDIIYPKRISHIRSEEYYINMMIAWYFATALAKQYDSIIPFIEKRALAPWTHQKTIQKAIESYRITDAQKQYLRSLRNR